MTRRATLTVNRTTHPVKTERNEFGTQRPYTVNVPAGTVGTLTYPHGGSELVIVDAYGEMRDAL